MADKITHKIAALAHNEKGPAQFFSLEFFPPKTQAGFSNLQSRLERMAHSLRPLFVTVTWGAGGSTAGKSLELAEVCQRQLGLTTCLHLTCTNMRRNMVDQALEEARALGIRNILALRGDPPRDAEYADADSEEDLSAAGDEETKPEFVWAVDLVRYIRKKYGDYFCLGVAGYPEGHADESCPEHQSVQHDLPYLVEKVKAGADFIMTQLTYDVEAYEEYEKTLRSHPSGAFKNIPIIPGLMPIQSYHTLKRITKLSHAKIPPPILERIEAVKSDDEAVKKVGVDILSEIVEDMKTLAQPESVPRGFHFYTLNLEKSLAFILERCHLIPASPEPSPMDSSDSEAVAGDSGDDNGPAPLVNGAPRQSSGGEIPRFSRRRASSVNAQPHNRIIVTRPSRSPHQSKQNGPHSDRDSVSRSNTLTHEAPDKGVGIPATNPTRQNNLLISEGQGALGREATWDDFPNGRWGPSHSPAFGEIDGYGTGNLKVSPTTARKIWGQPKKKEDITMLFRRVVRGELAGVPWSDEVDANITGDSADGGVGGAGALRAETETISKHLLALIEGKGYWTLASQPAVNGVRSDDKIFGWGPPGEGFVFQKAFVEFFLPREEWEGPHGLREKLIKLGETEVSWLKTDAEGEFESSESAHLEIEQQKGPKANGGGADGGLPASGVNAVTWGVFRGKEIVTPTIIEELSFRAWGEEAYGIWEEWRRIFPRSSEEARYLNDCKENVVLVNVVGQKFVGDEAGRLWEILSA